MALRVAKVIALFKKCDHKYQTNNYRATSLLSCFNKVFEKLCKRLVNFLEDKKILFEYQLSFPNPQINR